MDHNISRRALLGTGLAAGMIGLGDQAGAQTATYPGATLVRPALREAALAALARHEQRIVARDRIAIVDFALPSSVPRLHFLDIVDGRTETLLVAHGRGSDPDHSGMVHFLSDTPDSLCSSAGAFVTGETYLGRNGLSRRLDGLDPSNAHARERLIVLHAAPYVGPQVLAEKGKLGRSDGCFVVSPNDLVRVILGIGQGRLLYASKD